MLIGLNCIIVDKVWLVALIGTILVPGIGQSISLLPKKEPLKLFSAAPFGRIAESIQFAHMSALFALDVT